MFLFDRFLFNSKALTPLAEDFDPQKHSEYLSEKGAYEVALSRFNSGLRQVKSDLKTIFKVSAELVYNFSKLRHALQDDDFKVERNYIFMLDENVRHVYPTTIQNVDMGFQDVTDQLCYLEAHLSGRHDRMLQIQKEMIEGGCKGYLSLPDKETDIAERRREVANLLADKDAFYILGENIGRVGVLLKELLQKRVEVENISLASIEVFQDNAQPLFRDIRIALEKAGANGSSPAQLSQLTSGGPESRL